MTVIRTASLTTRSVFGALLALLLALRLLSPAGFMPAFEHGAVTIVACPDFDPPAAPSHHHHGTSHAQHQPCPYAAAGAAATPFELTQFTAALLAGDALMIGGLYSCVERRRAYDWPPAIGPPLPA